jgi:DNA-binding transcriptional LysR family regulator
LDATREVTGRVTVGGIESLCADRLPALLLKYCTGFPAVQVTLRAGKTIDLHGSLKAGLLDVYFTFGDPLEDPGLRCESVATERIVLVAPPNHRLSARRETTLDELAREDFLVTISGCPVRAAFEKAFAPPAQRPRVLAEFASIAAMRGVVEGGGGCALLPASAAREALAAGSLVALAWPSQQDMPISMRWRQQRVPSPALRQFLAVARGSLAA